MNSITAITVYNDGGVLMFDDPGRGIYREAFVAGADVILVKVATMVGADPDRFNLLFSAHKFPGSQFSIKWVSGDKGGAGQEGNIYELDFASGEPNGETKVQGWLCPTLFSYFSEAPDEIHFCIKPYGGPRKEKS